MTKKNALDLIAAARLPERTVQLCLRGDLLAEHAELEARLAVARRASADSLAGNADAVRISHDIEALQELMAEHTIELRLRALPRRQWAELVAKHPPRRDDGGRTLDADTSGVNVDAFMAEVLHRCIVDPELPEAEFARLVDECLTDAQYGQLTETVWTLNRSEVSVPFSRAASTILRASAPE